jgi:ferredoxin
MPVDLVSVTTRIENLGLAVRGGFHPLPEDDVPLLPDGADIGTLLMVGNAGPGFWTRVRTAPEAAGPDPIDRWTRRVLTGIADATLFPFGGPPHHPFQRWARRADPLLAASPLGLLIHPEFGLWHALRGALLFRERLELPAIKPVPSPCETCAGRPCLTTCPVDAFSTRGYDVTTCRTYLATLSGQPCIIQGCQARLACPVGRAYAYRGGLAQHHMRAFGRG